MIKCLDSYYMVSEFKSIESKTLGLTLQKKKKETSITKIKKMSDSNVIEYIKYVKT